MLKVLPKEAMQGQTAHRLSQTGCACMSNRRCTRLAELLGISMGEQIDSLTFCACVCAVLALAQLLLMMLRLVLAP